MGSKLSKTDEESKIDLGHHLKRLKPNKFKRRSFEILLSAAEARSLSAETHFNVEEVFKWHRDFLKDCPDGYLSKNEFIKVFKSVSGDNDSGSNYIFSAFDLNADGYIDFEEFLKAISVTTKGSYDEKLEMIFRMYDSNKDGKLERKELRTILESLFSSTITSDQINQIFSMMDINGDNKITKSEFMYVCSQSDDVRELLGEEYKLDEADF